MGEFGLTIVAVTVDDELLERTMPTKRLCVPCLDCLHNWSRRLGFTTRPGHVDRNIIGYSAKALHWTLLQIILL